VLVRCGEREGWSGRPGSNRRHSAWEADVLPLNYSRNLFAVNNLRKIEVSSEASKGIDARILMYFTAIGARATAWRLLGTSMDTYEG
jgi:hypothetical protein